MSRKIYLSNQEKTYIHKFEEFKAKQSAIVVQNEKERQ